MARSKFEVIYHDSRKQISAAERNSLLLSKEIKQIGPTRFLFVGKPKSYHTFADLAELLPLMTLPPNLLRRYLDALCVVFELALKRERQLEETPEALVLRQEQGTVGLHCDWSLSYAQTQAEARQRGAVMQAV